MLEHHAARPATRDRRPAEVSAMEALLLVADRWLLIARPEGAESG
jgi:hypothetical protein